MNAVKGVLTEKCTALNRYTKNEARVKLSELSVLLKKLGKSSRTKSREYFFKKGKQYKIEIKGRMKNQNIRKENTAKANASKRVTK